MAAKKASKEKAATGAKIRCPVCESAVNVKVVKHDVMFVYPCPSCNETIEAHKCCLLCDFGKKVPAKK